MANSISIPKSYLILGSSLLLAVLIGYFLAEPLNLVSVAVVFGVLSVLSIPLLLRWYHPMLVFCWNASISPIFLPGRPSLAALLCVVGLGFAALTSAVNPKARLLGVPSLTWPLSFLAAIVVVTGTLTGGVGFRAMGSEHYGGRKYFEFLTAIAGYFVLTSKQIQPSRASLYIALFFLSALSGAAGDLAIALGPSFHFLLGIFTPVFSAPQLAADQAVNPSMVRIGGLCVVGSAMYSYLLARFGLRGVLDLGRPWRLLLFLMAVCAGLYGGFRSYVAVFCLTATVLFFVEGLHRTRYLPALLGAGLAVSVIVLPQAYRLPLTAQRAICFLPGRFDPIAVESGAASVEWRVGMWKQVLPEVPQHLFQGKGWSIDPSDLFLSGESERRFQGEALSGTIVAGDYHNGPLSILIPFGIYGMMGFLWVVFAGLRILHRNYKFGSPDYRSINGLFLAAFTAHSLYFFVGFGSLYSDMALFTGLLGMSVALNGTEPSHAPQPNQAAAGIEWNTEYIRA
jgi:hypothetical protein